MTDARSAPTAVSVPAECPPQAPSPVRALRPESLFLPIVVYLVLVVCVLMAALRLTHGRFVYALDDAYIHMAIAKNLAAHGVFGVTSHEFTSASSSILWTFLLAALYKIFGPAVVIPLIAQIVFGVALLCLSWKVLGRAGVTSSRYAGAVLFLLVLTVPMVPMTFAAMEHLLHALATLLFATVAANYLANHSNDAPTRFLPVLLCAAAVTATRYEGLFLVAAVVLLFLLQKKIIHAAAVAAAGAVPVTLFGLYSIAHGGFFLPNSLLLKGHPIGIDTLRRLLSSAKDCPEVFVLALAALALLAFGHTRRPASRALLQLFLLAALLHQMLASYGWFYRYEAYLVALGLVAVAVAAWEPFATYPFPHRAWAAAALLLLSAPLVQRAYRSITTTPAAIADIYHQQIQMAEFFRTYYPQSRIAINDIGAISYYGDPYITDVYGLGSTEITRARLSTENKGTGGYYLLNTQPALDVLEKNNIEVVAIYDEWFGLTQAAAPPDWIKVGLWRVPEMQILGSSAVSFYGVGEENAARLRDNLAVFHGQLPPELAPLAIP